MTGLAFTEHACRHCLGAVLRDAGGFICSICRQRTDGRVDELCGCGTAVISAAGTLKRAGMRCVANPSPSPTNPAAFFIAFDGVSAGGGVLSAIKGAPPHV